MAGPQASSRSTDFPARDKCQAVHEPKTPAPTTTMSYSVKISLALKIPRHRHLAL